MHRHDCLCKPRPYWLDCVGDSVYSNLLFSDALGSCHCNSILLLLSQRHPHLENILRPSLPWNAEAEDRESTFYNSDKVLTFVNFFGLIYADKCLNIPFSGQPERTGIANSSRLPLTFVCLNSSKEITTTLQLTGASCIVAGRVGDGGRWGHAALTKARLTLEMTFSFLRLYMRELISEYLNRTFHY